MSYPVYNNPAYAAVAAFQTAAEARAMNALISKTWNLQSAPAATPTYNPAAGAVADGTVQIISSGASEVYYTTDGSAPTTESANFDPAPTPTVTTSTGTKTLKAVAVKNGFPISAASSAVFTNGN